MLLRQRSDVSRAGPVTTKSRAWTRAFTLATLLGAALACNGIREDELSCEEAVSHLSECCPGFRASRVDCSYTAAQGCGIQTTYPQIGLDAAKCIQSESCATMQSNGVCDRAAQEPAQAVQGDEGGFTGVCP